MGSWLCRTLITSSANSILQMRGNWSQTRGSSWTVQRNCNTRHSLKGTTWKKDMLLTFDKVSKYIVLKKSDFSNCYIYLFFSCLLTTISKHSRHQILEKRSQQRLNNIASKISQMTIMEKTLWTLQTNKHTKSKRRTSRQKQHSFLNMLLSFR